MGASITTPVVTPGPDKVLKFSNKRCFIWYIQECGVLYSNYEKAISAVYDNDVETLRITREYDNIRDKLKAYFGYPVEVGRVICNHPPNRQWLCECDVYKMARDKQAIQLEKEARRQANMSDRDPRKILSSEELKNPNITTDKNGVNRKLIVLIREHL